MSRDSAARLPRHPLLGPAWRPALLVSAQTSPAGNPSPSPLPRPCCRPHMLRHLPPSLYGCSAGPTELKMGGAGNTGLVNAEFIWDCVRGKLRFSIRVKVK